MNKIAIFILVLFLLSLNSCMPKNGDLKEGEVRINRLFLEVDDGDTIIYKGEHIRFLGVDAPEIKHPDIGFYIDQPYGIIAKKFTMMEIRKAKRITYIPDGVDIYQRTLAHVFIDGYPLSLKIVEEGFGYETISIYGDNGFPEIALKIVEASKLHPNLPFENPYLWRIKNRKK